MKNKSKLRVGNIVQYKVRFWGDDSKSNYAQAPILAIKEESNEIVLAVIFSGVGIPMPFSSEDIKFVELTNDMISDLGFIVDPEDGVISHSVIDSSTIKSLFKDVKYIHELQNNFYDIMGEEICKMEYDDVIIKKHGAI